MDTVFELPIGLWLDDQKHTTVELLETNGVAEKIITNKLADRPYTWQAYVFCSCIKSIGDIPIGMAARKEYLQHNTITIPRAIKELTLADANTLLVEIHRRVWQKDIHKQEIYCKGCGDTFINSIDLGKITMSEEDLELLNTKSDFRQVVVDLPSGLLIDDIPELQKDIFAPHRGKKFNRIIFNTPKLADAIRREKFYKDQIDFWRRIAYDCLVEIQYVKDGQVLDVLPVEAQTFMGMSLYNEILSSKDLAAIRKGLIEYTPTLPFSYEDVCACPRQLNVPYIMEPTSFFSE